MAGSRMGDIIKQARTAKGMTQKQLGKKAGMAESVIRDIEAGTRIISDEQSQRIMKILGVEGSVMPMTAEIDAANEGPVKLRPKPRPYIIAAEPEDRKLTTEEKQQVEADASGWLDALGGVLKRVPVVGEDGVVIDHRVQPVIGGRIEGGHPEKVVYFRMPDDSLSGFGIRAGDLLLCVPEPVPVDGAVMLLRKGDLRRARRVRKLPGAMVMLESYDREYRNETLALKEILFIGCCVRLERSL